MRTAWKRAMTDLSKRLRSYPFLALFDVYL